MASWTPCGTCGLNPVRICTRQPCPFNRPIGSYGGTHPGHVEPPEDPRIEREEYEREHGGDPDEADYQAEREAAYWQNVGWGDA